MKLRLRGASVRLRLTKGEVQTLLETGLVEEHVPFDTSMSLRYAIEATPLTKHVSAVLDDGGVLVRVPKAVADRWGNGDGVAMTGEQHVGPGKVLSILVEKDWACLQPRDEAEDADAFPHPKAATGEGC